MALNSSQEDVELTQGRDNNIEDNPEEQLSDDSYELFAACQRPCCVVLERLSEEEIQRHLSVVDDQWDRPSRVQKRIARNYLKDVPRVDFGLFAQYKRSRQKFMNRRNLNHASAEIGDFGFSSSEDFQLPSDEDYVPEGSQKKKRKRLAYEEDYDWNPSSVDGWVSPKPKKTLRNLRVNTRRKRIESNSSCSSDEDFEKKYDTRTELENLKAGSAVDEIKEEEVKYASKEESVPEAGLSASLLDSDLLSQIMQEMEDFNRKKGSKSVKSSSEGGKKSEGGFSGFSKSGQKRRASRVMKITDDLTPTIRHVQQVVKNMVNTVCSFERQREQAMEEGRKRPCKWCDSLFLPRSTVEELCKICKDVVKLSSTPKTYNKRGPKPKGVNLKHGAKSKIKTKVLKNLPVYEQRRLMYGKKVTKNSVSQQVASENNLTTVAAEIHSEPMSPVSALTPSKKRKLKKSSNLSAPKTKIIKTKKKKFDSIIVKGLTSLIPQPKKHTEEMKNHAVDKNSKEGLLRIDFPKASGSLGTLANTSSHPPSQLTKQPAASNVQYGTYLLPPIPTVVVANYATTDAKSGDYYLSSVYYQNEMTQAKNAPGRNENAVGNISAAKANSLPSMPSIDQLSTSFLDQLPNLPSLSFSQSGNMDTFPSAAYSINAKVVDSNSLASQQQVSLFKNDYNSYSLEHDLDLLLNNPNLQIQPVQPRNSSVTTESNIASLFSNPQLQIEPLVMPYESFEMEGQPTEGDNSNACTSENKNQSEGMPSKELQNSKSVVAQPTVNEGAVTPKPLTKSKDINQHQKANNLDSNKNVSEEPSEEDMSSEALFRKMSTELDAIGILGVVDLDKNPRSSLERIMETNKIYFEQLQRMKPLTKEIELKLKQAEDNRTTLRLAKTLLNTFGSFTKLSNTCLFHAKILQIKKEKNIDQEETRSSCQFSQSQTGPAYIDVMAQQGVSLDHIANIETQISSIPTADPSQYGTVHHFPAPASIPRSESRETPSRGSGPLTPARPESAMSQVEEPALTPLQIKKERMEAASSPSPCTFTTPLVVPQLPNAVNQSNPPPYVSNQSQQQPIHINQSQQQAIHINQLQQQAIHINQPQQQGTHINQPQQQGTHINNQASMGLPTSQDTFQILNEMTQRLQSVNSSQLQNMAITPNNQPQLPNVTIAQSNNQQMHNMMHFQSRLPGPPNVTVSSSNNNNQNVSKVLFNIAARHQTTPNNNPNLSNLFKNGQMVNIQHQNTSNLANANIMFKNTQMVNVQQVYLPSSQQRFQANNPSMNQYNIVQQGQMVNSQGQVLVNNAGQPGYSFQGQQMLAPQQQMPRISNMNAHLQQNQGGQSAPNQSFLMQNNRQQQPLGTEEPMFCALCGKPATLRCKQCAKIAYCDTKCAKTYWHSRHKSECKQMINYV